MQPDTEAALTLAENCLGILNERERPDAERLLELCRARWQGGGAPDLSEDARNQAAREGGRLVEVLARRSASAMPYAALGRAFLADLHGSESDKNALVEEFTMKVSLLGL